MKMLIISTLLTAILSAVEFLIIRTVDKHYFKNHSRDKSNAFYDLSLLALFFIFMILNYLLITFIV